MVIFTLYKNKHTKVLSIIFLTSHALKSENKLLKTPCGCSYKVEESHKLHSLKRRQLKLLNYFFFCGMWYVVIIELSL